MGDVINLNAWKEKKARQQDQAYLPDAQLIYSVGDLHALYTVAPVNQYDFAVMEQRSNEGEHLIQFFYPDYDW